MNVILYNVGRNLNRAYRTCFSFGIEEMWLIGNSNLWEKKKGNLYSANNKVIVRKAETLDNFDLYKCIAFENYYKNNLCDVDWGGLDYIMIGGESTGLPRKLNTREKATIPTINNFCLTVEASLAIVLYEWSKYAYKM